eukprot:snap_masked-scaffold_5-processed-gene-17.37-mRNA-1 protein AED:1.00 eAED:1.00 QI:0/0/0/0/1/1/2/0/63
MQHKHFQIDSLELKYKFNIGGAHHVNLMDNHLDCIGKDKTKFQEINEIATLSAIVFLAVYADP